MSAALMVRFALVIAAALAASCLFLPPANTDIFWHLSAGRRILAEMAVPRTDFLSWSEAGREWIDFEWLPQIFYYKLYSAFGVWGLQALKIIPLAGAFLIFTALARMYGLTLPAIALLPALAAALLPNLDVRPENFSLFFFMLTVFMAEAARLRHKTSRLHTASIGAIFAVWANCHAGFACGLLLLGCYTAGNGIEFLRTKKPESLELLKTYAIWTGLAAAGTLINPFGIEIYTVLLTHAQDMNQLRHIIMEWQPPRTDNIFQAGYWGLLAGSALLIIRHTLKFRRICLPHALAWTIFAYASLRSARHTGFFALAAFPAALYCLKDFTQKTIVRSAAAAAALCVLYIPAIVWPQYKNIPFRQAAAAEGACRYLLANKDTLTGLRLYNSWDWGGYMGFRLYPDYPVFQDGRYLFHKYLAESQRITNTADWLRFTEKYGFGLAVMERKNQFTRLAIPADKYGTVTVDIPYYSILLPPENWAVVFWDGDSVILVRRTKESADWIAANELKYLKPNNEQAAALKLAMGIITEPELDADLTRCRNTAKTLSLTIAPAAESAERIKEAAASLRHSAARR